MHLQTCSIRRPGYPNTRRQRRLHTCERPMKLRYFIDTLIAVALLMCLTFNAQATSSTAIKKTGIHQAPVVIQKDALKIAQAANLNSYDFAVYINYSDAGYFAQLLKGYQIIIPIGRLKLPYDWTIGAIAHEMAHIKLKHAYARPESEEAYKRMEKEADLEAKRLMKESGFDECQYAEYWKFLHKKYGSRPSPSHPKHIERYEYLKCD